MSDRSFQQPPLPLDRGSITYLSTSAWWRGTEGWELRLWHGHGDRPSVCEHKPSWDRIETAEMRAIVAWYHEFINDNWRPDDGRCRPLTRHTL